MSSREYPLNIVRGILLTVRDPEMASGGPPSAAVRSTGHHRMRHAIIACSTQRLLAPLVTQRLQTTSFRGDDMSDDDRATQAEELIARMKAAHGRAPRRGARRIAPGAVYSGRRVDCQATICHCPPLLT
jgi:hypothetical protein